MTSELVRKVNAFRIRYLNFWFLESSSRSDLSKFPEKWSYPMRCKLEIPAEIWVSLPTNSWRIKSKAKQNSLEKMSSLRKQIYNLKSRSWLLDVERRESEGWQRIRKKGREGARVFRAFTLRSIRTEENGQSCLICLGSEGKISILRKYCPTRDILQAF